MKEVFFTFWQSEHQKQAKQTLV